MRRSSSIGISLVIAATLPAAQTFQLDSGTLLAQDSSTGWSNDYELLQFSPKGVELASLTMTVPDTFGVMDGLTVVNGELWVSGTFAQLARIDLTTGATVQVISTGLAGTEALGTLGNDLLVGYYGGLIQRWSTSGVLLHQIDTTVAMTGIVSDGQEIHCANYQDGVIYSFDLAGSSTGFIPLDTGGYSVSGLALDETTNTFWVSTGFGPDDVRNFDDAGNKLASFDAGWAQLNGLEFVPSACLDLFVPQLDAGTTAAVAGRTAPLKTVVVGVALQQGTPTPLAARGFCVTSLLDPPLGLVQFVTASDAAGDWQVSTPIPAGLAGVTLHFQALALGSCPADCGSGAVSRSVR